MKATMKPRAALALVAAAGLAALAGRSIASDHLDGPRVTADPAADVTDVFAFTSPEDPSRVVLIMAVTPYATDASTFSSLVNYAFRVERVEALSPLTLDTTPRDVVCTFSSAAPQKVTCTAPGGLSATATVGEPSGGTGEGMRVFAGLRSDPAFFDRQGALATVASGRASFTGTNAFAGANVLAIVVEIESAAFTLGPADAAAPTVPDAAEAAAPPILAVAAETVRLGM
jgi:hypothetical protein